MSCEHAKFDVTNTSNKIHGMQSITLYVRCADCGQQFYFGSKEYIDLQIYPIPVLIHKTNIEQSVDANIERKST